MVKTTPTHDLTVTGQILWESSQRSNAAGWECEARSPNIAAWNVIPKQNTLQEIPHCKNTVFGCLAKDSFCRSALNFLESVERTHLLRDRYTNCMWKELVATSGTQYCHPSKWVAEACMWKLRNTWNEAAQEEAATEWSSKSNQSIKREKSPRVTLVHTASSTYLLSGILLIYPDSSKCLSVLSIRETRCLSHREQQQSQELCTPVFCL